jgi:hypothetical protein
LALAEDKLALLRLQQAEKPSAAHKTTRKRRKGSI